MFYKSSKTSDGESRPWTKNLLIKKIVNESKGVLKFDKSAVLFSDNVHLTIDFIKDNYSESGFLTINGSVNLIEEDQETYIFDLFSFSRDILKKRQIYSSTTIGEYESWDQSSLAETFNNIYYPLLNFLNDEYSWKQLYNGDKENINFKAIKTYMTESKFDEIHKRLHQIITD